jgi:lysophospholipase L1-like esterase
MRKVLSIIAAAAVVITASVAVTGSADAAVVPGEYVALGDSYASGVGAFPYDAASGDCKRSPNSYPQTWKKNHPKFVTKDMTCSGATIADVRANQLSALSSKATVVTITIGGNDDGFTPTVTKCLTGTDQECADYTNIAAFYARHDLVDQLAALYTDVKRLAPNARVLVLTYTNMIDPGTGSCGAITPNAFRRTQLRYNAYHLAEGIRTATERAGVKFVDMRLPFEGHEACSADPWINGVDAAHQSEIFHPNLYGHSVVYTFMLQMETDVY